MKLANIAKLATAGIGLSTLAMNSVASAAVNFGTSTASGGGVNNTGVDSNLIGTYSLVDTVQKMVSWLLGFCAIVATLYGIYGGFLYLTSGGNDEQTKKAKTIFKQVAIGLLIIFLAYSVVEFFQNLLTSGTTPATGA